MDAVFGIESRISDQEEAEFVRELRQLKTELRFKEQEIDNLKGRIAEKDQRLEQAHSALAHYRKTDELSSRKVQPWVFNAILALLILSIVFIIAYLVRFDIGNSQYGLFSSSIQNIVSTASDISQS